jgi:hypothetical protein
MAGVAYIEATNTVYMVESARVSGNLRVHKSTDYGATWTVSDVPVATTTTWAAFTYLGYDISRGRLILSVVDSPTVASMTAHALSSTDGGATWTDILIGTLPTGTRFRAGVGQDSDVSPRPVVFLTSASSNVDSVTAYYSNRADDTFVASTVTNSNNLWRYVIPSTISYSPDWKSYVAIGGDAYSPQYFSFDSNFDNTLSNSVPVGTSSAKIGTCTYDRLAKQFLFTTYNTGTVENRFFAVFKSKYGIGAGVFDAAPIYDTLARKGIVSVFDPATGLISYYSHGSTAGKRNGLGYLGKAGSLPTPTPTPSPSSSPTYENLFFSTGDTSLINVFATSNQKYFTTLPSFTLGSVHRASAISPDNTTFVASVGSSPFINVFKRTGNTFTKLADPIPSTLGYGSFVDFLPNGEVFYMSGSVTFAGNGQIVAYRNIGSDQVQPIQTVASTSNYGFTASKVVGAGKYLLSGLASGSIDEVRTVLADGTLTAPVAFAGKPSTATGPSVAFVENPTNGRIIVAKSSGTNTLLEADIVDGVATFLPTQSLSFTYQVFRMDITADGKFLYVGYINGSRFIEVFENVSGSWVLRPTLRVNIGSANIASLNVSWNSKQLYLTKNTGNFADTFHTYDIGTDGSLTEVIESFTTSPPSVRLNSFLSWKTKVPPIGPTPTPTPTPSVTPSPINLGGLTWVDRTIPTGNWASVTYSPSLNLYVAVGTNGSAATSTDAITWTTRTTPNTTANYKAVTWSEELGLFAAVNQSFSTTGIMTSPDGITWTLRTTPELTISTILWSKDKGIFVAGTNNQRVLTSTDGITWNASVLMVSGGGLAYSESLGRFVAVGGTAGSDKHAYSSDGISWTVTTALNNGSWNGVAWSPELSLFVAVSYYGDETAYSSDGISWTRILQGNLSANAFTAVIWAKELNMFVLVGAATDRRVRTSYDGKRWDSWPSTVADSKALNSVTFNPNLNLLVAVGNNTVITGTSSIVPPPTPTPTPSVSSSATNNGNLAWTQRTMPETNGWSGSAWSPTLNRFVAVAINGTNRVATSQDGKTWVPVTNGVNTNSSWRRVIWADTLNLFVAIANSGTVQVMTSPDGLNWTPRVAAQANQWMELTWSSELGLIVAVAYDGADRCMTSPDGINWTVRTMPGTAAWYGVTWSPKLTTFVAVASNGWAATSPDGINWTQRSTTATDLYSVVWSPEREMFAAVGGQGASRIQTSVDGVNWVARVNPVDSFWVYVTWAKELGLFVAVAAQGSWRVMTSPNGIHWTSLSDTVTNTMALNHILYSPTIRMLVALGASGACATAESTTIPHPTPTPTPSASPIPVAPFTLVRDGTVRVLPAESDAQAWSAVAYSETLNRFVTVARSSATTDSASAYSDDGLNWTGVKVKPASFPGGSWVDITWSGTIDKFVAIPSSPNGIRAHSTDGITWTYPVDTFTTALSKILWVPELGKFFATYNRGVVVSTDGISFTAAPAMAGSGNFPTSIGYCPKWDTLYIGMNDGKVMQSKSGTAAFTQATTLSTGPIGSMMYNSSTEQFIIMGQTNPGSYVYTSDGAGWTVKPAANVVSNQTYSCLYIPSINKMLLGNAGTSPPRGIVDFTNIDTITGTVYGSLAAVNGSKMAYSTITKTAVVVGQSGLYMALKSNL